MTTTREVDVVVVGGGPSGLAAARHLAASGAGSVLVLEREAEAGGVPRHCFHLGYGVRDLHRMTSGPRYARALVAAAVAAGAQVRTSTMVTGWADDERPAVRTTSPRGLEEIRARAVLLATGVRERPRAARLVPGDRPPGVWTTGQLQQAVHLQHAPVGRRGVVVGAELVSYSAVMTLRDAGVDVVAMVTEQGRPDTYRLVQAAAATAFGVPLLTRTRVTGIRGRRALEAVEIAHDDGRVARLDCDTAVFTGDWMPDHELARAAGIRLDAASRAPVVDTALATERPGVFAAGNLVHPAETADLCALGGRHAADSILAFLHGDDDVVPGIPVTVAGPLAWVSPQVIRPDHAPAQGHFVLRASRAERRATVEVEQAGRTLHRQVVRGGLVPGRPVHVGSRWLPRLVAGSPVTFRAVAAG